MSHSEWKEEITNGTYEEEIQDDILDGDVELTANATANNRLRLGVNYYKNHDKKLLVLI